MKVQDWIFSVRYQQRYAVIGPARASTVEAALHLAEVPESVRAEICACTVVRDFVEGRLDPDKHGYYACSTSWDAPGWVVCIGSVQEVLS